MIKKYLDFRNNKEAVEFLKGTAEEQLDDYALTPLHFGYWYFYDRADNETEIRLRNLLGQKGISKFIIYNEE